VDPTPLGSRPERASSWSCALSGRSVAGLDRRSAGTARARVRQTRMLICSRSAPALRAIASPCSGRAPHGAGCGLILRPLDLLESSARRRVTLEQEHQAGPDSRLEPFPRQSARSRPATAPLRRAAPGTARSCRLAGMQGRSHSPFPFSGSGFGTIPRVSTEATTAVKTASACFDLLRVIRRHVTLSRFELGAVTSAVPPEAGWLSLCAPCPSAGWSLAASSIVPGGQRRWPNSGSGECSPALTSVPRVRRNR